MLDNMSIADMKKAVQIRNTLSPPQDLAGRQCVVATLWRNLTPKLEASGGINLKNVKRVAASGVEMISVGDLTHSVSSVDISLEIL